MLSLAAPAADSEHAGVGEGSELAEDGVGEAFFFADVLKEARGHAASEKIIEDRLQANSFVV